MSAMRPLSCCFTLLKHGFFLSLLLAVSAGAQPTEGDKRVQDLENQLRQLKESFEQAQQAHQRQLEVLQKQIDSLKRPETAATATNMAQPAATTAGLSTNLAAQPVDLPKTKSWSPAEPIKLAGNERNYLNLSLDGLMTVGGSTASDIGLLEPGGHDPKVNGFTLQNLETVFQGAVDPYFRAQANIVAQIDSAGNSSFELEEAYGETTSLPWNLQVKAGQYLTEFGRLNPSHPHTWMFVDAPLVTSRLLGPEGLRNPGLRVSWLTPTSFYSELMLGIQNSQGETAWSYRRPVDEGPLFGRAGVDRGVSSFSDMLYAPRYAVSFDLNDEQVVLAGLSAALGPNNSGEDTYTRLYGVDLTYKWRSRQHHGGFPFLWWQSEFIWRSYDAGADSAAGLAAERLDDYGFYSQVLWGFRKGWVAGLRGDYITGNQGAYFPDADRETRWRISPNLTWYPTEFSKFRLQYNYDRRDIEGTDHSVWLQFEFLLGAHAAHKF
jgi:hypothetical protein